MNSARYGFSPSRALTAITLATLLAGCSKIAGQEISCASDAAKSAVLSQVKAAETAHPDMLATASEGSEGLKAAKAQATSGIVTPMQAQHEQAARQCEAQFRTAYASIVPTSVEALDRDFSACVQHGGPASGFDGSGSVSDACSEDVRDTYILRSVNTGSGGGATDLDRQLISVSQQLVDCIGRARRPLYTIDDQVLARVKAATNAAYDQAVWQLGAIRTQAVDKDTAKVSCLANVKITLPAGWDGAHKDDLPYSVEKTSDGKLYVTLTDSAEANDRP